MVCQNQESAQSGICTICIFGIACPSKQLFCSNQKSRNRFEGLSKSRICSKRNMHYLNFITANEERLKCDESISFYGLVFFFSSFDSNISYSTSHNNKIQIQLETLAPPPPPLKISGCATDNIHSY